ncbi:MAG: tetratricopeptide repeat protein [Deltaproteobacteria bacterium]|nr:tetratricopeptide repeat protein [Deltaproteobacteria bacterium]
MLNGKIGVLWLLLLTGVLSCATLKVYQEGQANFDRGLALFNHGDFKEAISYFQRATEENPGFAQAYLYLGRSYLSMRRWREAIQPLRTAYRLSPEETKDQIFELMMDAFFGAALGANEAGRPGSP